MVLSWHRYGTAMAPAPFIWQWPIHVSHESWVIIGDDVYRAERDTAGHHLHTMGRARWPGAEHTGQARAIGLNPDFLVQVLFPDTIEYGSTA